MGATDFLTGKLLGIRSKSTIGFMKKRAEFYLVDLKFYALGGGMLFGISLIVPAQGKGGS